MYTIQDEELKEACSGIELEETRKDESSAKGFVESRRQKDKGYKDMAARRGAQRKQI